MKKILLILFSVTAAVTTFSQENNSSVRCARIDLNDFFGSPNDRTDWNYPSREGIEDVLEYYGLEYENGCWRVTKANGDEN